MNKITRRNFLQLMGASAAALALMGCSETGNRSTSLPTLSGRSLVVYCSAHPAIPAGWHRPSQSSWVRTPLK